MVSKIVHNSEIYGLWFFSPFLTHCLSVDLPFGRMPRSRHQLHIWGVGGASPGLSGFRDAKGEGEDKSDSAGLLVGPAIHRHTYRSDMQM